MALSGIKISELRPYLLDDLTPGTVTTEFVVNVNNETFNANLNKLQNLQKLNLADRLNVASGTSTIANLTVPADGVFNATTGTITNLTNTSINSNRGTFSSGLTGNLLGNVTGSLSGNAQTATRLNTTRTFRLTGDIQSDIFQTDLLNGLIFNTQIQANTISNSNIKNDATIAGTKITPDFGAQNIIATGTITLSGNTANNPNITLNNTNGTTNFSNLIIQKSRGTTGPVLVNDTLGEVLFRGLDNQNTYRSAGRILGIADGTTVGTSPSNSFLPGALTFQTSPSSAPATILERMRITSSGNVGIGTNDPTQKLVVAHELTDGGWLTGSGVNSYLGLGGHSGAGDGAFRLNYNRSTGDITFNGGTRDTPIERMRINNTGTLAIGAAPFVPNSTYLLDVAANAQIRGNLKVNTNNISGDGIDLSDDGDIVDLNDGFCSMRFSSGVQIYSGNSSGSGVIALRSTGLIQFANTTQAKINLYSDDYGLGISSSEMQLFSGAHFGFRLGSYNGSILAYLYNSGEFRAKATIRAGLAASTYTSGEHVVYAYGGNSNNFTYICGRAVADASQVIYAEVANVAQFEVEADSSVHSRLNSYGSLSDISLKQDVTDYDSQWNDIKNIRLRKYRLKSDVKNNNAAPYLLGVIAQEVELISPGLIGKSKQKDSTEIKTVKYSVLYLKAIKALQEAMTRIETLEAKVQALQSK